VEINTYLLPKVNNHPRVEKFTQSGHPVTKSKGYEVGCLNLHQDSFLGPGYLLIKIGLFLQNKKKSQTGG
jgi:hypothetical protein